MEEYKEEKSGKGEKNVQAITILAGKADKAAILITIQISTFQYLFHVADKSRATVV